MKANNTTRGTLASNQELAQRITELERRLDVQGQALSFLKTILEQLKESGYRLAMTSAQHAELNRWLNELEKNARSRFRMSDLH
jgi:uncharacterized coiled-coil protein SlyX